MTDQQASWERQSLDALSYLGKALGQISLYSIGHPAVAQMLGVAAEHLNSSIGQSSERELSFSIDGNKLIANGRIVGSTLMLPSVIPALFGRFKLSVLSFKAGLTETELVGFCELCLLRTGDPLALDPQGYLRSREVSHITLNEAVYAKMSAAPAAEALAAQGGGAVAPESAAQAGGAPAEALLQAIKEGTVDGVLGALVDSAVTDPARRAEVQNQIVELVRGEFQKRLDAATKTLIEEKNTLANEQTRTQNVLQNAAGGVIMVDESGKILMMNSAAEEIYGTTLSDLAGQHLAAKIGEEHLVTLASEIATPKDRPISTEVSVAGSEEAQKTLKASGAVVQNEAGKVVGIVSQLSDAAKHRELVRLQKDFVSHITHELRAPLSSIRAALEILQGDLGKGMGEDERKMIQTAMDNSGRLGELINSILDFSKIESGQMMVAPKKSEAEAIAREAVESLLPWAAKKKIAMSYSAAAGLPPVFADGPRTVQVLVNLLSNAIKFTPVGGRITVEAAPVSGGQFVKYSVNDTGCGIPKKDQKRIFEKFVQIASGEMYAGGTGLGLSIAKALIHMQGGQMWLESEPDRGSTFFFSLPVWTPSREGTAPVAPKFKRRRSWWRRLIPW